MTGSQPMEGFSTNVDPGPGAVARWSGGVVVAGGDDGRAYDLMASFRTAVGDEPSSGDVVVALRSDPRFNAAGVDLAVAVEIPGGIRVFVRGQTEVRTEENEVIGGPEPVERDLEAPTALWIGLGGPPLAQGHPVLDLRRGVVAGRGAVVYRNPSWSPPVAGSAPAEAAPPAPGAVADPMTTGPDATNPGQVAAAPPVEPAPSLVATPGPPAPPHAPGQPGGEGAPIPSAPFESIDWAAPAETRSPLPVATQENHDVDVRSSAEQVMGVRCSRDHFNNPKAGYCQVCGISMVNLTRRLVPGPRPTLGFVVFADGATYAVDRPYLIGRSPTPPPDGGLTALPTQDATQSVSREHAELRLDGWDVLYTDLGSTNGSFVWSPASQTWTPLRPREPMMLASGTTISVGRMTFIFQGASKEVEIR